ncbi:tRNA lysidine(34) synthetase TilS [bacterium]|nr:tRNA lysidine(34) synthetase TilS [bacterium]
MKRTEQKVLSFIDRFQLINKGDKILVAFSGGPDSVFALHFLNKFSKKFKIVLIALHFNHGLRGKESDEDENFAMKCCEELNVPFISRKLNVKSFSKKNKLSIEEAARLLRYKNIEKIAHETGCNKIVTAHNQSDNTETILMNLFSGTGLSGLNGIPIQRENIIRPLLCLSKLEIIEYLSKAKINSRFDSSNLNDDFRRNYIRNRILPLVKEKLNPNVDETVFRSSQNLLNALHLNETLIEHLRKQFVTETRNAIKINIKLSNLSGGEIPGELLKNILKKKFGHALEYDDFIKINTLITKQKGKQVHLTSGIIALRESDSIRIERFQKASNKNIEIKAGNVVTAGSHKIGVEFANSGDVRFNKGGRVEFISADNLGEKFNLRVWNPGDKFKPLGMKQLKKVSDFLTDEKIPSSGRKNQLVLLSRNQIVWIVGLRIDDRFKLNSKTKKIYKLWVK